MAMKTNFGTSGPCLQGTVAADLVLCMHAKGPGVQKFEERDRLSSACSKRGEGAQKAFGAFAYGGGHEAFAYGGQEEQEGAGGTREEKGQESLLEHPCSAVFSVKHICVVASRAKWSEIK